MKTKRELDGCRYPYDCETIPMPRRFASYNKLIAGVKRAGQYTG